jgi:arylsulfatase A-like enzyme
MGTSSVVRLKQHRHADRAVILAFGVPVLVIATMLPLGSSFAAPRPKPDRPGPSLLAADLPATPSRVALITIDALRADFVSFMGHRPRTTPFLDSLAESGVVFTEAEAACSWTSPSLASLLTSLEPSAHGLVWPALDAVTGRQFSQTALAPSLVTLAETFQAAGWLTIGVASNLHLRTGSGFDQGFDFYYRQAEFMDSGPLNRVVLAGVHTAVGDPRHDRWKKQLAFLWVHYFDPHDPYQAREPWISSFARCGPGSRPDSAANLMMVDLRKRFPHPDSSIARILRPLYESEIRATDESLRALCDSLDLLDDNVLLIVTADHGEEFAEHGGLGHMTSLHREQLHVPLLVRWPRTLEPGRIETPVSLIDIYPTLVELLGLSDPGTLRGKSLVPRLRGEVSAAPRPIFAELVPDSGMLNSVRLGDWRLLRDFGSGGGRQLYNVRADPTESTDLAAQEPEIVQQLREAMVQWRNTLPPVPTDIKETPIDDPEMIEKLRSLGYIH